MQEAKQWDAFVSHASEDKTKAAGPLTHALQQLGVRVWLDAFEVRIGDPIRRKIDEGLANSRFGVVVASPTFFAKQWATAELDALFGMFAILPVLHDLGPDDLRRYSPLLAGRMSLSLTLGIEAVAASIADRIFAPGRPGENAAATFARTLASAPNSNEIVRSLSNGDLSRCMGLGDRDQIKVNIQFGNDTIEFCVGRFQQSSWRLEDWTLVFTGSASSPLFDQAGAPSSELAALIAKAKRVRNWIRKNLMVARSLLPGLKLDYQSTVVLGRRDQPGTLQAGRLAGLNDSVVGTRVRTYDWILDSLIASRNP